MLNKKEVKQIVESEYKVLDSIERKPANTQRNIAKELNFSIGKVNYVMQSLFERGLIKVGNFAESKNKSGYMYILTPKGIKEKINITKLFLEEKVNEYEQAHKEIIELETKLKSYKK